MYMSHPFPRWTKQERERRFHVDEYPRYQYLGLAGAMRGARFLEVGCGTGMRSMLAAKNLGVGEFVGFDHSTASLNLARQVAEEEEFDRFTPMEGDLFKLPFPNESFDIVVSWGVLHHTHDPWGGFREMVRVCKPGGYLALYLYNYWNHWRHNLQKARVDRLAGPDYEERFRVAHRLYGTKPVEQMTPADVALFYDQYCHPHKSDHTYGEILRRFEEHELEFWGSFPPLRFRDFITYVNYRSSVAERFPLGKPSSKLVVSALGGLAGKAPGTPPFRQPTFLHNFFWQGVLAWIGRGGEYSEGSAFSARKPLVTAFT
jgi:ubiquinone/menaquinone biosynthesis C-methylase UbiE